MDKSAEEIIKDIVNVMDQNNNDMTALEIARALQIILLDIYRDIMTAKLKKTVNPILYKNKPIFERIENTQPPRWKLVV